MSSKAALISVSDKTGLVEFAKGLKELGYVLLATKGSMKFLADNGVQSDSIEEYTGQDEILDGRVKTLHPKIYAGLLAKRNDPVHMQQLKDAGIYQIDVAIVNLYPFLQNLGSEAASDPVKMVELVDIGGPCMIRAASKNHATVYAVCDPADYGTVLEQLQSGQSDSADALNFRRKLAFKVWASTSNYDLQISRYFSTVVAEGPNPAPSLLNGDVSGMVLRKAQSLRYGENPNQQAAYYRNWLPGEIIWEQLGGKELSYNNFLDFDAAAKLVQMIDSKKSAAVIIKHLNPCGAAEAGSALEAIQLAKLGDPRSHFGGIVAINCELDAKAADEITADFAEIVVAPSYSAEALQVLKTKKNLRIIKAQLDKFSGFDVRSAAGGILIQESDQRVSDIKEAELVSDHAASAQQLADLQLAWRICAHVKSNAIVICKDGTLQAVGAGQMSRIDSTELAISKARTHGHNLEGAVAASDAFFPFPDSLQTLAAAGVKAVIVPKGSLKDPDSIAAAKELGVALYFTADRHFRH